MTKAQVGGKNQTKAKQGNTIAKADQGQVIVKCGDEVLAVRQIMGVGIGDRAEGRKHRWRCQETSTAEQGRHAAPQ